MCSSHPREHPYWGRWDPVAEPGRFVDRWRCRLKHRGHAWEKVEPEVWRCRRCDRTFDFAWPPVNLA